MTIPKNVIILAPLALIVAAIPATIFITNTSQDTRNRAQEQTVNVSPIPTSAQTRTLRGIVVSFDRNILQLRVNDKEETLSLKNTADFQWVSSGNYDQDNAQLTKVTLNHLNPGFEVLVTINGDSNDVLKVIILKRGYE